MATFFILFRVLIILVINHAQGLVPPNKMPEDLVTRYTMEGEIPSVDFYVDDTIGGKGIHHM